MQHTVLVVDDDPDIRESLRTLLEDEGFVVRSAADGAEAVAMMEAEPPCFVVLDLMMPIMDGWEVAGRMHDDPRLGAIPVCVVTATPEWAPADSTCVLQKPVDVQALLDLVHARCDDPH
ncbi:MAG TPA: response regulator [Polyangia bacterium]|nr:response regulator [Polyangia bacterium]